MHRSAILGSCLLGLACGSAPPPAPDPVPATVTNGFQATGAAPASRADLRLKRWRQLQLDLEGALGLSSDELCNETGLYACTDIHVVPLGGVSVPNGLYRPIDEVSATTGQAIERLVLGACWSRLSKDLAAIEADETPVVFGDLDLLASDAPTSELSAMVTRLSQRLLARDPVDAEQEALLSLHQQLIAEGASNADWCLLSCFALGTTTEALSY